MKNVHWIYTISFSTLFALSSFFLGTLLFICYIAFPSETLLLYGFLYVAAAVFFNLIILINLIIQLVFVPHERTENTIRILILLSNLPIAVLYFNLIMNHK